jgi:hypothetical protein
MSEQVIINIVDIVGGGHCTASEDGQKVYQAIELALKEGKKIELSFKGVEDLTSAFLNSAVGRLYNKFEEKDIRDLISISDASQDDLIVLKRVVTRAKHFFNDPERFRKAKKEALGYDTKT